MVLGEICW